MFVSHGYHRASSPVHRRLQHSAKQQSSFARKPSCRIPAIPNNVNWTKSITASRVKSQPIVPSNTDIKLARRAGARVHCAAASSMSPQVSQFSSCCCDLFCQYRAEHASMFPVFCCASRYVNHPGFRALFTKRPTWLRVFIHILRLVTIALIV